MNQLPQKGAMLSDTQIRATKPGNRPVRLYDERGLYLEITANGGRWWRFKCRFAGKEKLLSMGTYPDTGPDCPEARFAKSFPTILKRLSRADFERLALYGHAWQPTLSLALG